jgi:hypothetical protein
MRPAGFTDTKIGRGGAVDRAGELCLPVGDSVTRLALFNTCSTRWSPASSSSPRPVAGAAAEPPHAVQDASPRRHPADPFIVPTVLSAIAFWWIYDSQFSIISGR